MTKRIFYSIFSVTGAALFACVAIVLGILYGYFTSVEKHALSAQTELAAKGVEQGGMAYLTTLTPASCRITWVDASGLVLYDSQSDPAAMENHGAREEIVEARTTGTGEGERMSATRTEKTLYRAVRLTDGTVLRLSVTLNSIWTLTLGMLQPLIFVLAAVVLIAALLARALSRKIVGPLNELDLDHPLENVVYDELSPLLTRIEQQHRQITAQITELKRKQDEFSQVTDHMSEGLLLLDGSARILSINPAAKRLLSPDMDCLYRDMLSLDRTLPMQNLVSQAQAGHRGELLHPFSGRTYQIDASPVRTGGSITGVCLLFFDVTGKQEAERQRREFSANVSHELKTPLQSIMGAAELIEQGLVQPGDLKAFGGRIHGEAMHLLHLINDIIRLSQLDENVPAEKERVDLKALAEETVQALSPHAEDANVSLAVLGEPTAVFGVRRMLSEILYNLTDNAIRYNRPGGTVEISVFYQNDHPVLTVSDTGIGIPPEDQDRIFERFYRVDKSHSRQTGGTGLGLSIVKHGAKYHKAVVTLTSRLNQGTKISLTFPRQAVEEPRPD